MKFAVHMDYETMNVSATIGRRWYRRVDRTLPLGGSTRDYGYVRSASLPLVFDSGIKMLLEVVMSPEGAIAEVTLNEPRDA